MRKETLIVSVCLCALLMSGLAMAAADVVTLAGPWRVRLDSNQEGEQAGFFRQSFTDAQSVKLPGSLDEAGLGKATQFESVTPEDVLKDPKKYCFRPARKVEYIGAVWYQRDFEVPQDWAGRPVELFIERALWETRVWVDDRPVGVQDSLCTPHRYELGVLTPGRHRLTVRVDNSNKYFHDTWQHGYCTEVQTIWNGMTGKIELRAHAPVWIREAQVFPNAALKTARVVVEIGTVSGKAGVGQMEWTVEEKEKILPRSSQAEKKSTIPVKWDDKGGVAEFEIDLGAGAKLWDEFDPNLYEVGLTLAGIGNVANPLAAGTVFDTHRVSFGLRDFTVTGPYFSVNGRRTFLRGVHDGGNFPLTGYPATDVESWRTIFATIKAYGLNHVRYHTWTPPEAAFEAADEAGIYLQTELPNWIHHMSKGMGGAKDKARDEFLDREYQAILKAYGNHPSFCMMSMGNEVQSDASNVISGWVKAGMTNDSRHVYVGCTAGAGGGQYRITPAVGVQQAGECWKPGATIFIRGQFRFPIERPRTDVDYGCAMSSNGPPVLSHETGQWAVYPNFNEISKYTGVLRPWNLEVFKRMLDRSGMGDQAAAFLNASGKLSLLLYREELEIALRSANFAGFQMLDLHDYPGQGSATVGMLDAFWESKGLVSAEEWRRFCSETVPLLRMKQRVWTTGETFTAQGEVAHWGRARLNGVQPVWSIRDERGRLLSKGTWPTMDLAAGAISRFGEIKFGLAPVTKATRLTVHVGLKGMEVGNDWNIWVYPAPGSSEALPASGVMIAPQWGDDVKAELARGGCVLLLDTHPGQGQRTQFTTPLWNTMLFDTPAVTYGMLCDPRHPALSDFPTDSNADWQWWELLTGGRCAVLNDTPSDFRPIVQMIDKPQRANKLGAVFEAKVGKGRLLACTLDLSSDLEHRPVARQLRASLLAYAGSRRFKPKVALEPERLDAIYLKSNARAIGFTAAPEVGSACLHVRPAGDGAGCEVLKAEPGFWCAVSGTSGGTRGEWKGSTLEVLVKFPKNFRGRLNLRLKHSEPPGRIVGIDVGGDTFATPAVSGEARWVSLDVCDPAPFDGQLDATLRVVLNGVKGRDVSVDEVVQVRNK